MKYPTRTQIKEIANFVKEACFKSKWKYKKWQWDHVVLVRKHALKLADKVKADKKIVEVAALLHDIGRIKYKPKNHEITSAKETEKILKKLKLDEEFIKKVKAAVLAHRGGKLHRPKTKEEKIIAVADAISHLDVVPHLISLVTKELKLSPDEARKWTYNKVQRAWKKISLLPAAKKLARKKYEAIKLVLSDPFAKK